MGIWAPKHMGSKSPLKRRRRRFCSNCHLRSRQGRPHAWAPTWKPVGSSTTPCSPQGRVACAGCELTQLGKRPAPSHRRTPRSVGLLSRRCGSAMASQSMHAHELAKALRVSWLAEHLDAVLAQTLATRAYRALNRVCVGEARRVRAQRVEDEDFPASRTNATIPDCASCCRSQRRATRALCCGRAMRCWPSSTGTTRWSRTV